jgi:NDP-sugar pyrophosphorylase family protein
VPVARYHNGVRSANGPQAGGRGASRGDEADTKAGRQASGSPSTAVVLAAGNGTRMAPLTPERPKALLPTLDRSQLSWVLGALGRAGIDRAFVNAAAGADQIEAAVAAESRRRPMGLAVSREDAGPLGTAGALKALAAELTGTFVVANADIATDFPIEHLIEAHHSARAPATLLAIPAEDGADLILEESWVIDLIDRRELVRSGHRYGGVAVLEPEVLALIPAGVSGLYETVMTGLIRSHQGLAALEWAGYWLDLATPRDHLQANLDVLSGRRDPKAVTEATAEGCGRFDVQAYVGRGAVVAETELRHSIVGHDARLEPGARLERCVVWDGARVPRGNYRDAIITPGQTLKL